MTDQDHDQADDERPMTRDELVEHLRARIADLEEENSKFTGGIAERIALQKELDRLASENAKLTGRIRSLRIAIDALVAVRDADG